MTLEQEFKNMCKQVDEPANENRVKAYANFDKPGWTKFQLVHLIIKQAEEIGELRDRYGKEAQRFNTLFSQAA